MNKTLSFVLVLVSLQAQSKPIPNHPNGKPIVKVFTNFHTGFGRVNDDRGFSLERSYIGYKYSLTQHLSFTGILDVGKSNQVDDVQRIAYLKNMMVQWNKNRVTVKAGLIPTIQFGMQEKFWGHRFVRKSFQDEYKFGKSADLGISLLYEFNKWLTADALIVNGEGYRKIQLNDGLLYGAGFSIKPLRGVFCRIYCGINQDGDQEKEDTYNLSTFIGYTYGTFSIGSEYNFMRTKRLHDKGDEKGWSVYSTVGLNDCLSVFGRYDQLLTSKAEHGSRDEKNAVLGMNLNLGKYVRLAPTFTYKKREINEKAEFYAGIYCCFEL